MIKHEIGKPFQGAFPSQEGAVMELWQDGMTVLIQMPNLTRQEKQAFKKSFSRYSFFESNTPVPIPVWVFDYKKPFGQIDVNFDARKVKPEYVADYLTPEDGQVKNRLMFYLLDGDILTGIKMVGLRPAAVKMFHDTIKKQLETGYTAAEYDRYLQGLFNFSTDELFKMGKVFKK